MLDDQGDDEPWVIDRRPADKPRVVLEVGRQVIRVDSLCQTDDLGGAGLARHRESRQRAGGSMFAVNHQLETAVDLGKIIRVQRKIDRAWIVGVHHHMWGDQPAAVGEHGERSGELDSGGEHGALADGHRDRFTGVPRRPTHPPAPFGVTDETGRLGWEADTGAPAESENLEPQSHSVDAQPLTELVVVDIARCLEGSREIDHAVTPPTPAAEPVAVEDHAPGALDSPVRGDDALRQGGQREKRFDGRTGRVGSLKATILERVSWIFGKPLPILG